MKKFLLLLLCICVQPIFAQIPSNWDTNPPRSTEAFKYEVGISDECASEQEAFKGAWQDALQKFAQSISTHFQGKIDKQSKSESYASDIEDEFTVVISKSSFSSRVKVAGAREVARKPIEYKNGKYIARVLVEMSGADYEAAKRYAKNEEAAVQAYNHFLSKKVVGIPSRDRRGNPSGYEDYFSWMRNTCVILSFAEKTENEGALLEQLEFYVKKLYKNTMIFASTIEGGSGARIVYDTTKYYDGISRALQNLDLFRITKQEARLTLAPVKSPVLADFKAEVVRLKDSSKFVITGIETIQTESKQVNNAGNIVINQFKSIASKEFGLVPANYNIPSSYLANGSVDEDGIISYIKSNFNAFPARFLVICYSETNLSAAMPEFKVSAFVNATCRFTLYDSVTGEFMNSNTVDTKGFPGAFQPANMQEQTIIAESRKALQFLFNAKNKPGLAGIMREVLGKL